jgi:hypothetical protein
MGHTVSFDDQPHFVRLIHFVSMPLVMMQEPMVHAPAVKHNSHPSIKVNEIELLAAAEIPVKTSPLAKTADVELTVVKSDTEDRGEPKPSGSTAETPAATPAEQATGTQASQDKPPLLRKQSSQVVFTDHDSETVADTFV